MGIDATMYVAARRLGVDDLARLAGELCEAFGREHFVVDRTGRYHEGLPTHALVEMSPENRGRRVGLVALSPGHVLYEVRVAMRYYGEGYERGDPLLIVGVTHWLQARLPEAVVFYGGDGDVARFDEAAQHALVLHFFRVGHRPYREGSHREGEKAPVCTFCGGLPFVPSLWGGGNVGADCAGCGERRVQVAGSSTWEVLGPDVKGWGPAFPGWENE